MRTSWAPGARSSLRCAALLCVLAPAHAYAQSAPFTIRGFADAGARTFTASRSFEAIFGESTGVLIGGGIDLVERRGIFAEVRASRFSRTGQRVFVFGDQVFPLGIENTITMTPLEISGGYRFGRWNIVPYAGGGVGWYLYRESSRESSAGEDASGTFAGYHVLGGAEIGVWRWISAGAEIQWTTVPDVLGRDPNGVSRAFGESNLGGLTARIKVIVGR